MFAITELIYQLRRKKQTAILIAAAMLLIGCVTFYLGNIRSAQAALDGLAESVPVRVTVTNRDGGHADGLSIHTERVEALSAAGVHDVSCRASLVGAMGERARAEDPFKGGDTVILGANTAKAAGLDPESLRFKEGKDASFFFGTENFAVVGESYASDYHLKIGDTVTLPVYLARWNAGKDLNYVQIGEISLEIIGLCSSGGAEDSTVSFYVPVEFMREQTERAGEEFCYQAFSCTLDDPMELNDFKRALPELGFLEQDPEASVTYIGNAVTIDDEIFIKTAGRLRKNLSLFQRMMLPFFGLILTLSMLSVFLTLHSGRRDMAVSLSLGQPKKKVMGKYLLYLLFLDLLAGAVMLPVIRLAADLTWSSGLLICGSFLLAAAAGGFFALLLLLRFDPIRLLAKAE